MSSFLPKNYEIPVDSNYMKLVQGENKFRVLDSAIIGQVFWIETKDGRKPIRKHQDEKISPAELDADSDVKHFWAFPVWNVTAQKVQIIEITQKTIMNSIKKLTSNADWGDPKDYDIVITKEGEGRNTEYNVTPSPKKEIDPGIVQLYKDMHIEINLLYEGGDPFKAKVKDWEQEAIVEMEKDKVNPPDLTK